MAKYVCEGYVSEVLFGDKKTVEFKLSPSAGYSATLGDGVTKKLLFLKQGESKGADAVTIDINSLFSFAGIEPLSLLLLKINRLKVRIEMNRANSKTCISSICVL